MKTNDSILIIILIIVFFVVYAIMPSLSIVCLIEGEYQKALAAAGVFLAGVIALICYFARQRKKSAELMAAILAEKRAADEKHYREAMNDDDTKGEK